MRFSSIHPNSVTFYDNRNQSTRTTNPDFCRITLSDNIFAGKSGNILNLIISRVWITSRGGFSFPPRIFLNERKPMNLDRNDFKTYSLADNPNMKLSDNLSLSEVASKCGANSVRVHPYMPIMFQAIRNEFGASVTINSGYRSPQHNANVGGATESTHIYGMALDLSAPDLDGLEQAVKRVMASGDVWIGGFKRYKTFIHVDCWKLRTW